MRQNIKAILLLSGFAALYGCGQTGPLYLPEDAPEERKKSQDADAPAAQTSPETAENS